MSEYQYILFDVDDRVATITLNRPDVLNAYIPELGDEIHAAFASVRDDPAVRAVILTGAGRGFCAGLDRDFMKNASPEQRAHLQRQDFIRKYPLEMVRYPKPVLVAINGPAIGVGVTMSLPCDLRIAGRSAQLGIPFAKLGMLPGLGSTHLLPKLVGLPKALELVLTARTIGAEEAGAIGLVNKVVPDESLLSEAREMAELVAACHPGSLEFCKRALHEGAGSSLEEALRNESALGEQMRQKYPAEGA